MASGHDGVSTVRRSRRWWLIFGCVLMALVLLLRVKFQLVIVGGDSMRPTFGSGDLLIVDKRAYRDTDPRREDVVVARYQQEVIVKRVVALPGEAIEVKHGTLHINGARIAEAHPINGRDLDITEGRLLPGRFALLGDNRSQPVPVTVHAIVTRREIGGKVVWAIRMGLPGIAG
jgi:signal peptidase I